MARPQNQTHEVEVQLYDAEGRQISARGGQDESVDFAVGTAASPVDLNGSDYESSTRNIKGANYIVGEFESDSSATFSIEFDWLNSSGDVLKTTQLPELTNVTSVELMVVRVRRSRVKLRLTDTSGGTNLVHGTANAN